MTRTTLYPNRAASVVVRSTYAIDPGTGFKTSGSLNGRNGRFVSDGVMLR